MSRFATLDSLRKKAEGEEGKQSYYAGGASSQGGSGVSVYGGKRPENADQLDKIFAQAKRPGESADEAKASEGEATTLTFWSNGFQVDDGEFRSFENPDNKAFMADVEKGYVPAELRRMGKGTKLVVKDKRREEYKPPPPPPYTAFSGAGNSMDAAPAPEMASAALGVSSAVDTAFAVDASKPTTAVRVTMADGKRRVFKFNKTHTVGDLLSQVAQAMPSVPAFAIMAGFPPKPLSDASMTIDAAGLCNSSVRVSVL